MLELFTIGFTRKSAEEFFTKLQQAGVRRVVDVRLNNLSQLAGFSKKDDLKFFLERLGGIEYVHQTELAPTQPMLDEYKKNRGSWEVYAARFLDLLESRRVAERLPPELFDHGCLLCSEDKPHHCHRRVVAEYLERHWGQVRTTHLV